jgi:hypothetical protein
MFQITLDCTYYGNDHTVSFEILTKKDIEKYHIQEQDICFTLPFNLFAYKGYFSRSDLVASAGLDPGKVDFAVPLSFQKETMERWNVGDWAVWDYTADRFGIPVWNTEIRSSALKHITDKLALIFSKQYSS